MSDIQFDTVEEAMAQVTEIFAEKSRDLSNILHREILVNALKTRRDGLDILDLKVLSQAMAEFRYAARTFKPYRNRRKVSIFGSARTPESDPYYQYAVKFARMLAESGFMVITGAAEGIMKAGNAGAGADNSFGINILLPFEQSANAVIHEDPKLITFKYFFTRKIFFLMEAHAVALFPGGFGTHDEGFETLTLLQTGKAPPMPFLLMELPGEDYWHRYDQFIREQLLGRRLIAKEDLNLYRIMESPEDAVAWIKHYYSTYHSMRLVRGQLVVRLQRKLSDDAIETLNSKFSDLVRSGKIAPVAAFPDEANEPDLLDKPRIACAYNQQSPSRLNEMILAINNLGSEPG